MGGYILFDGAFGPVDRVDPTSYTVTPLQTGNCFFSATGVTDGDVLQGVRYQGAAGASTESLVMRSRSGTVRRVSARHVREKLREISGERVG